MALVYYDLPYIVCRAHTTAGHYSSWETQRVFGPYGTYKFRGKLANTCPNAAAVVGGLELHHGWATEGIIMFFHDGTDYRVQTSRNNVSRSTVLAGENWTYEREFKFEWKPEYVRYYIDDVFKHEETAVVPDRAMALFSEVGVDTPGSALGPIAYFLINSFQQIE